MAFFPIYCIGRTKKRWSRFQSNQFSTAEKNIKIESRRRSQRQQLFSGGGRRGPTYDRGSFIKLAVEKTQILDFRTWEKKGKEGRKTRWRGRTSAFALGRRRATDVRDK